MAAASPVRDASRSVDERGSLDVAEPSTNGPFRILIVDDDRDIRLALSTYFSSEGFDVETAADGRRALELMTGKPEFDLVLLDVVLPEMNGFEVLARSQEIGIASPVLMMSARGDHEDILKGFGLGAQDYIVKPFEANELHDRTDAVLGRSNSPDELPLRHAIGDRMVDLQAAVIIHGDSAVDISEMELDILRCLVNNRGCVVTKKRLLREAWRIDDDLIAHTINPDIAIDRIDQTVQSLRRKLEPTPTRPTLICTVYGLGYRLSK